MAIKKNKYPLVFRRVDGNCVKITAKEKQFDAFENKVLRAFGVTGVYTLDGFKQLYPNESITFETEL